MPTSSLTHQIAAVEAAMAIHRATFAKLLADGFSPLVIEFLEDAAATYQQMADHLREAMAQ